MNQAASNQAFESLQDALTHALMHDEMSLQYQPIVDGARRIIGMEALMRWNSAEYGQIPPSLFVPLAERSGAILNMGAWALQAGCQQLQRWSESPATAGWTLSINVSARQFNDLHFVDDVLNLTDKYQIARDRLILEVTESMFLNAKGSRQQNDFRRLRDAGLGIAVDDFGTGFSSMQYLRYLSISRIKIDKTFVDEVVASKKDQGIVGAILMLADALEADVVAEGVETAGQLSYLKSVGCSAFQGFLFGRPGDAALFTQTCPTPMHCGNDA